MKQSKEKAIDISKAEDPKLEKNVHKARYLGALKENKDKLDKAELGKSIGFSREYTDEIVGGLVADGKITSSANGTSNLKPTEKEDKPENK